MEQQSGTLSQEQTLADLKMIADDLEEELNNSKKSSASRDKVESEGKKEKWTSERKEEEKRR